MYQQAVRIFVLFAIIVISAPPVYATREKRVTVNFVDVELSSFTKFTSEVTGKNFVFDDRIKGKVTVFAPSEVTRTELYSLFLSVLELKGFTLLPVKINTYKIIPAREAREKGLQISSGQGPVNENYIIRLIDLKDIGADTALSFLQPIISKDGYISAFAPGNSLLIVDSGLNVEKVLSILELIDIPDVKSDLEMIPLQHANAEEVASLLAESSKQNTRENRQLDTSKVMPASRLNALIVIGDKATRDRIRRFVSLIDVPPVSTHNRVNVYFLENADAGELAKVLQEIVKSTGSGGAKIVQTPGASDFVNISYDKTTNALVVIATPADYQNLVQVIKQLDQRPRQVFVEAMIVEASIDQLKEAGAKWRGVARQKNGKPIAIGGFGSVDALAIDSIIAGLSGFSVGGMGNYLDVPIVRSDGSVSTLTVPGFAALFSLNQFRGAVDVLSTPQILTSDNKEAEIIVGENVPFITRRESDPSRTMSVFSSIERKDVGINLKLTPHIAEGDYVKLDIYQEISAVKEESEEIRQTIGPTTTKRATKTSVVVRDKQTVVIGGLMQERKGDNIYKLPILGDIPILGWLFKFKSDSKAKTNLLVFLTPHIIKDSQDLGKLSDGKRKEFAMLSRDYKPGEIIIRFRADISDQKAQAIVASVGAEVVHWAPEDPNTYHVKLPPDLSLSEAMKKFGLLDEVEIVSPVYLSRN